MTINGIESKYYIVVFYLLYCFNTPVYAYYYKVFLVINFVLGVLLLVKNRSVSARQILFICVTSFLMLFALIINIDIKISTVIAVCMLFIFAVATTCSMPKRIFETVFVRVLTWISAVSVIIYVIARVSPGLVARLPIFLGTADYPTIGYVFFLPAMSHIYISTLYRNEGMFCEMGVFACLIIFAILIILKRQKKEEKINVIILLITLVTTLSTTGFLAMAFILPEIYKTYFKGKRSTIFYIAGCIGILLIKGERIFQIVFQKFNSENNDFGSFAIRFQGTLDDIRTIMSHPLGAGVSKYFSYGIASANTITYFGAVFGIVFSALTTYGICKFFLSKDRRIFSALRIIALLICMFTQGMSTYPLYYLIMLYGIEREELDYESKNISISSTYI